MGNATRHRVILACGLALAFLPALPGCKAVRKWLAPADAIELTPSESPDSSELTDRQGLGIRLLVVDDTNYDAPRALRAYPMVRDERVASQWSRWGYRIVEVPVEDIDPMLSSLRPVQPISLQFMGEFGNWRPLVRSGTIRAQRVAVGDSTREVGAGRPRLIARSWTEPALTDRGVERLLRIDLGMQIEMPRGNGFELVPEHREPTLDDQGTVIDELLSSIHLDGTHALVIVGEAPGEDWDNLPEITGLVDLTGQGERLGPTADDERDPESTETADERPGDRVYRDAIEPSAPRTRSLGELMLVAPGSRVIRANESRAIPKRVVIVLIPEIRDDQRTLDAPSFLIGETN